MNTIYTTYNKDLFGGVMFPYRKALFREMIYFFIMCIVMPALLLWIVDSDLIFLVIGFLIFVISGCIIVSLPVFYEYLDYKNFREIGRAHV